MALAPRGVMWVEADAVIGHGEHDGVCRVGCVAQRQARPVGPRVPHDIAEALGGDAMCDPANERRRAGARGRGPAPRQGRGGRVRPGLGGLNYPVYLSELSRLNPDTPLMLEHLSTPEEYMLAAEYLRRVAAEQGVSFV